MAMPPRFEELIDRHHDELFAYLWRLLGKERGSDVALDVEDLVQDVFLRAYENYARLRPDSNVRAWLYKIATNCAFTKLRRVKVSRGKFSDLDQAATSSAASPGSAVMSARLRALVAELPGKQKVCVTLRYLQDLDYSEIAEILHCSEAGARANVYQAIQRLRAVLKEDTAEKLSGHPSRASRRTDGV
jgi:RNA polymerase sigma-70 factor, ECF subfamily